MENDITIDCIGVECHCGARFEVIAMACGRVNCPKCGASLKAGACD